MTCQEVRTNLAAYLQQKLSKEETFATARHLSHCTSCASELDHLRQVDMALERFIAIEPSPYFDARLTARLDELESQRKETRFGWGRIRLLDRYAWSLVVLLVTTAGVWLGIRHQQYRELNSLQKVIEAEDRYLGSSTQTGSTRSGSSVQTKEPAGAVVSGGQKALGTPGDKDEEIPEEDKALLENLELLQNYEILNSLEVADHRSRAKQRAAD